MNPNHLYWSLGKRGDAGQGTKMQPSLDDLLALLQEVSSKGGMVSLSIVPTPEAGPCELQVSKEGPYSLLTLGVDTGEDYITRNYFNTAHFGERVGILGDTWDDRMLTMDFCIVFEAFKQFFEKGDVSEEILS